MRHFIAIDKEVVRQTSDSIFPHLQPLFQEVRQAVTTETPKQEEYLGRNPKGDSVKLTI
jgi:hypothetical protein